VILALTALSHLITTLVVVLASLPLLLKRRGPAALLASWGVGFSLVAFWAVPLLARVGLTTDMRWFPVRDLDAVFPRELWPILILAVAGFGWAAARRKLIGPALTLAILPIAGFYVIQYIDFRKLYNARLLPFWYFIAFLFAGVAVGVAVQAVARRARAGAAARWVAAAGAGLFFLIAGMTGISRTPAWAQWNFSGYEGKAAYAFGEDGSKILQTDYWAEYSGLMATLDTLPEGRVMWEANRDLNRYGTPMALMLTGYWSEGHPSMEGLLFESSLTTPFHFINASEVSQSPSNPIPGLAYPGMDFDRAVAHLALYDVAYYVSFTESATQAAHEQGLQVLATPEPFTVFGLQEASLVDVGAFEPAVWDGEGSFVDASLDWYDDVESLDRWLVEEGPEEWRRVDSALLTGRNPVDVTGDVSNVVLENHKISFTTTAVGVPHLVKVSYFPNWTAQGAEGPYRAAPSLMVVVPTQEEVVIEFKDTWAESSGKMITLAALLGFAAYGVMRWRRRRVTPATATSES